MWSLQSVQKLSYIKVGDFVRAKAVSTWVFPLKAPKIALNFFMVIPQLLFKLR